MAERQPIQGGEYLVDGLGVIWRIVRDGGMVTTADDIGIVSAGIQWLRDTRGPVTAIGKDLYDRVLRERDLAVQQLQDIYLRESTPMHTCADIDQFLGEKLDVQSDWDALRYESGHAPGVADD